MDTTLLSIIAGIAAAIGIKEIWNIWKKKLDIKANKNSKELQLSTKVFFATISDLKDEIKALEIKIEQLIEENTQCAIKLARMEERLNAQQKI
jgi:regulator of replication initiation timing